MIIVPRRRYGSSGATVEDPYAHRGKVQRYKLVVPPVNGYERFVAYFATRKHAYQTAKNLKSAGYKPKIFAMVPESGKDTVSRQKMAQKDPQTSFHSQLIIHLP